MFGRFVLDFWRLAFMGFHIPKLNLGTTVDAKNKLLIDYRLTNANDKKAMGGMLARAKTILRSNGFTALYDKGYHTGSEFHTADRLGIETLVAIPAIGRKSQAPDPMYNAEHFKYDPDVDTYTCPQGNVLTSNQTQYKARNYTFKQYKTKACKTCPVRQSCTTSKANGKIIQRSQYTQNIQDNAKRIAQSGDLYKKRQALVEHPYGTIKRQWGFDHIITKRGIAAASADLGLMVLAYNLKRLINLGVTFKKTVNGLIVYLLSLCMGLRALMTFTKPREMLIPNTQVLLDIDATSTTFKE